MAKHKKGKSEAARSLKSVVLKLRHGAQSLEFLDRLNGCPECEVTIVETSHGIDGSGKLATIFPATIKSRGGKWRLATGSQNSNIISIDRAELLERPRIVNLSASA